MSDDSVVIKSLRKKVSTNNLVITKADKGNTVVIATKTDYHNKITDFLNSADFEILKKDPTVIFNTEVKNIVRSTDSVLKNTHLAYILPMNPLPPRLYGFYKLHKQEEPIRPVVSYTSAPAYKLAKKANTIFKSLTKFNPKYTIRNSQELINNIKDVPVPENASLISFDVKNLFSNIPIKECMNIIDEILCTSHLDAQEIIDLKAIFKVCLDQNYFIYNGNTYKQKDGLAMGSPLSPLCADIFMNDLESRMLETAYKENIVYWYRYVDDVICLWKGEHTSLHNFFNYINTFNNKIQFTMEIGNKSLNFLDLTVDINLGRHKFNIFRKPTYSENILHANSCHPHQHKHASFHAFVHRLLNVPLDANDFRAELNTIKHIAVNNGYKSELVDTILRRARKKMTEKMLYNQTEDKEEKTGNMWVKIPYIGPSSYRFQRFLQNKEIRVAFYTTGSLKNLLCNNKDKFKITDNSGIYSLTCGTCGGVYIGQTGRKFKTRIKEHITDWKKKTERSTFAEHLNSNGHNFDPDKNIKYLHILPKSKKMDALEALEINRHKKCGILLNDQTCLSNSILLQDI